MVKSLANEKTVLGLRAKLFALAHFASVPQNSAQVKQLALLNKMVQAEAAFTPPSHLLRGTLIASLSLIASTPIFEEDLIRLGWRIVQFGQHQRAAVPRTFPERVVNIEEFIPEVVPEPNGSGFAEIVNAIKHLAWRGGDTLFTEACRLFESAESAAFRSSAIARYAHQMLAKFPFGDLAREAIVRTFAEIPVVDTPEAAADTAESAAFSAALELGGIPPTGDFPSVTIPELPVAELAATPRRCPEAYMSDTDFLSLAGIDKARFYRLPVDAQRDLRRRLFPSRPRRY
jgi:hypothetical protein